ncbi:glycoprotein vOX2-2 [Elephant endotheliotropic herpesvirus 5B]|nr:glycoprotein vOX2-2 [Elephant endotheliotropic herpesvirus 5B]UVZ35215.1 glycoprotein vOX2-2 [Elephant endotheliotropic herpesvirus 5B]
MYPIFCFHVLLIASKACAVIQTLNISSLPYQNVTLNCTFMDSSKNIFAIHWKKDTIANDSSYIASIRENNINRDTKTAHIERYNCNVNVTSDKDLKITTLTIFNITEYNESCFICSFKVKGELQTEYMNKSCIILYDNPTVALASTVSQNKGNITCLSTGYLSPSVKWIDVVGFKNSSENITNDNGTISVKNTIYLENTNTEKEICCKNNIGNVTCMKLYKTHKENFGIIAVTSCIFVVIFVIGIIAYRYRHMHMIKRKDTTDYSKMKL